MRRGALAESIQSILKCASQSIATSMLYCLINASRLSRSEFTEADFVNRLIASLITSVLES